MTPHENTSQFFDASFFVVPAICASGAVDSTEPSPRVAVDVFWIFDDPKSAITGSKWDIVQLQVPVCDVATVKIFHCGGDP
jgi:hypothetical protein